MNQNKKEKVNFRLPPDLIALWIENDESKYTELIKELQNSDELIRFLNRYLKDRWEAELIDYIELIDSTERILYIQYSKRFFSGCKNLDKDDEDYLKISFDINFRSGEIEIMGEPVPEDRTTLDEF